MADLEFVNFLDPFSRHALLQAEIGARQPTSRSAGSQALEGSRGFGSLVLETAYQWFVELETMEAA